MKYLLTLMLTLSFSSPGFAAVTEEDFAQLKNELMSLLKRVDSLEAENKTLKQSVKAAATDTPNKSKAGWADNIKVKGDFRYRYENIDAERSDTRERNRVRARVEIAANLGDNTQVGIGLASGGDDPVSTNQTLGGGGSTKDIRLDLAYFKWQAKPGLTVTGGKMKNTLRRVGGNGLMWDGDYRPEGLAVSYKTGNFFLESALHFLESDSRKSNNRISYGFQGGLETSIGGSQLLLGAGYVDHSVAGEAVFYGDADDFFGNSFGCTDQVTLSGCNYANNYEQLELFAELKTQLGEQPLSIFADYIQNQDASDLDTAWATGLKLGKASNPNTWEVAYIYQDLEADAVFGLLTDSDFAGGGTDSKGHILTGAWAVNKQWKISFTYFNTERQLDLGTDEDYQRLMLDMAFKF
jgi:hypothetical protein